MQQLRETKAPGDPKLYHQRANPFTSIEIVILRGVNQIESSDPANYTGRKYQRCKIELSSLGDPGADRSNGQRQSNEEMRRTGKSFCDRVEKNYCESEGGEEKGQ